MIKRIEKKIREAIEKEVSRCEGLLARGKHYNVFYTDEACTEYIPHGEADQMAANLIRMVKPDNMDIIGPEQS